MATWRHGIVFVMTINTLKVWVFNETKHIMGLFLTEIYRVAQVVQEPEAEQVNLKKKIFKYNLKSCTLCNGGPYTFTIVLTF